MAKFGSLSASALAASAALVTAEPAFSQASELAITLDSGEEMVLDVSRVEFETQSAIFAHLEACLGAAELTRDECAAEAATRITEAQLDGVVRETNAQLGPLSDAIAVPVADLIREPVFCHYAPTEDAIAHCTEQTEAVQLAALDVEYSAARERRIQAESQLAEAQAAGTQLDTEAAELNNTIADVTTERDAEVIQGQQLDAIGADQAGTIAAQAETIEDQAETILSAVSACGTDLRFS